MRDNCYVQLPPGANGASPPRVRTPAGPGDGLADVAFRGRGYDRAVDLPGSGRLTGVFAQTRAARGEPVGLRLEPGGCHVFPG